VEIGFVTPLPILIMYTVKCGQQLRLLNSKPPPCIQNLEQHELELKCHYTTTGLWFHLWQLSPRLELRALAGYRGCPRRKDIRAGAIC
jgi:hypothetical protein